jgi:hypothetical protein
MYDRNKIGKHLDKLPIAGQLELARDALDTVKVNLCLFGETMVRLSYANSVFTDEERATFTELGNGYLALTTAMMKGQGRKDR